LFILTNLSNEGDLKMNKKFNFLSILSPERAASPLQMSLTLFLVICLVLSNILVVKSIDLFGIPALANTCSMLVFPVTYILSDIFSEVYGYKWSRITATWAFIGTALCSILFAISIALPGNASWENQEAFEAILGNAPMITIGSVVAFYLGDWANDKVFQLLKDKLPGSKWFAVRAIGSSLVGKYVDGFVFTFIGLHFLPLSTKIIMVINCPFVQICFETLLLPLTIFLKNKIMKVEQKNNTIAE
jgi:uncharacterized integral membrane protein (TIGR00697 family)